MPSAGETDQASAPRLTWVSAEDIPDELDLVLAIGLAKTPRDRFQTGENLADALVGVAQGDLSKDVRKRGDTLLARLPWGASVK